MRYFFKSVFLLVFFSQAICSQTKTPAEFLGYELGQRFSRHDQVVDYFAHVAENNPNVKLISYGKTYENRTLQLAIVTSQENFNRLDNIRANQLRSAKLIEGTGPKQDVAVVWLSYNVHGNESVSTEVAMKVMYELINPDNQNTKEWLKNTVVIIDPCINPDGRERYVNWYTQKGNTPYNNNPDAIEHHEPWPGGRVNHYLFDLNRDWAWATQVETQQRLLVYNQWMPNVHVDFHEQNVDNPYYFAPAAEPYNEVVTDFQKAFEIKVGNNHAKYFDQKGWLYFTNEIFDMLYPSYGDTYPMFNGAIGMTYEQGGSERAGLGILNKERNELTLKDRIEHHFTTSLSTIEVSSKNATELNDEFAKYFEKALTTPADAFKTYVIKNDNQDKLKSLMELLDRHQIRYGSVAKNMSTKGFSYRKNENTKLDIKEQDLIISSYQAKSNLIKALFEPETKLNDSLTYDITAWSLPYARGLDAFALRERIEPGPYTSRSTQQDHLSLERPYAYISKWNSMDDVSYLSYLLQKKIKVRFSERPFVIGTKNFAPGSLVITRAGNEKVSDFDSILRTAAIKYDRNLTEVASGLVSKGADLGSAKIHYLKAPKIALLTGEGVSAEGFGSIWHFFEQQIQYQVTILDTSYFPKVDLHDYDVLLLPSGNYQDILDKENLTNLKKWVEKGGKLIVLNSAISVFAKSDDFEIAVYESEEEKKAALKSKDSLRKENQLKTYNDEERNAIPNMIIGSIFKASLDNTNPLGFGYSNHYYTLKNNGERYAYLKNGYNVSVIMDKTSRISGFAGSNALNDIGSSLVYGVEKKGKGTVVYLVDDPLFRSFWENGKLLFSNAIFMVGQ
jgi:hypothetical protein